MDRLKLSLLALQRKVESQLNCEGQGGIGKGYLANARKGKLFLNIGVETNGGGGGGWGENRREWLVQGSTMKSLGDYIPGSCLFS